MQHKGEIVEKAIRQSGYSITKLAKKLGKSPRWMYYMFESNNVPIDYILEIGEFIHHDFSEDIKELKKYKASVKNQEVAEQLPHYKTKQEDYDHWKNKYLELLEIHNQLLLRLTKEKKNKSHKK
jgi:predicted transcriptional regulator